MIFLKKTSNLSGEAQAGGNAAHGGRNQVVEISIGGVGQPEGTEADIVESFVVHAEGLARILHQMMHGQGAVVRLNHRV